MAPTKPLDAGGPQAALTAEQLERRRFLSRLSWGLSGVCAAIIGIPFIGFLVAPLLQKPPKQWRPVGNLDQFPIGQTRAVSFIDASPLPWAGVSARTAAWVRRLDATNFVAFSVNCTHLGCPVRWLADAELFLCPCHGGVYYKNGDVAAGPPPAPLPQYPIRVRGTQIEILTSPIPVGT